MTPAPSVGGLHRSGPGPRQPVGRLIAALLTVVTAGCGAPGTAGPDLADRPTARTPDQAPDLPTAQATDPRLITATDAVFAGLGPDGPGCQVAVSHAGAIAFQAGYGLADVAAGTPMTPATTIDVASVSKQITAGVVMRLVDQGELDLSDPVTTWLPDLRLQHEEVTVADLVHHTSGLPDYTELLDADLEDVTTNDDALSVLDDVDAQAPGQRFEYSNTNYLLLGQVVESVTGLSLPQAAQEMVFAPLGMTQTRVRDDQGTLDPGQAVGYIDDGDGWTVVASSWRQTGDGAVHTTVTDLLRWAGLFLGPPRAQGLGSASWRQLMVTPGPVDDDGSGYAGGIGIYDINGTEVLYHGGSWVGVASYLQVQPTDNIAVAVACNIEDIEVDGLDIEDLGDAVIEVWTAN